MRPGLSSVRPVQIRLKDASVWQPPLPCNDPPLFVIPRATEGSAVPRTSPGNAERQRGGWCFHEYLVMIGGGCGPVGPGTRMAHCRSLGYPRDDKKGRAVARQGRLLDERAVAEPRHLSNLIWTGLKFSRPCGTHFGNGVLTHAPGAGRNWPLLGGSQVSNARPHGTPGQAGAPIGL